MHNSRIKLSPIKIWCQTWQIWLWKDWAERHKWQKSQGNSQQTSNQLGRPGWRRIFWGRPKFYIDSMYENSGYAYNMSETFF